MNQRAFAHLGVGAPAPVDSLGGMQCCVAKLSDFLKLFFLHVKLSLVLFLWQLHGLAEGVSLEPRLWASGFSFINW